MQAALPALDDMRIAILGLGYVGLPLAAAFGKRYPVVGFDIDAKRIDELGQGYDHTLEVSADQLRASDQLRFSCDPTDLVG